MRIILICLCRIVVGGRYSFGGVWGVSRVLVFILCPCLTLFILILVLVEILRVGIGLFLMSLSYF
jgi:hypothetical protein